jgi:parallel beta-helix repeat protein
MRSLVVLFFFFILILGVGTIIFSVDPNADPAANDSNFSLGQIASANQITHSSVAAIVDRYDDSEASLPCTAEPNDCTLRSAINIANSDGKPTTITFADSYLISVLSPLPALKADNTIIKAPAGQEVHLNGNNTAGSVLRITGAHVKVNGLRIYGAGSGYPNIAISDNAYDAVIANNIIGDNDAPFDNCGSSNGAYSGVYVDASGDFEGGHRAWIYGNIIECNRGIPGDGITIRSDKVIVGKDVNGSSDDSYRNTIRLNNGFGVNLTNTTHNTICDNDLVNNVMGGLYITNFHNNTIMNNKIVDIEVAVN